MTCACGNPNDPTLLHRAFNYCYPKTTTPSIAQAPTIERLLQENKELRGRAAADSAALQLAREAIERMDAAEVKWRSNPPSDSAASEFERCRLGAHLLSVQAIRAVAIRPRHEP